MKKVRFVPAERALGILLGSLLALTFFFVSFVNVLTSQSFYLGQDKRYAVTNRMSLKNTDQFRDVYHSLQAAMRGQEDFNVTLYRNVPESLAPDVLFAREAPALSRRVVQAKGEALWNDGEEAFLRRTGTVFTCAKWVIAALFVPLIVWLILCLKRRGRIALAGVGWYAVFASVLTAALLNILFVLLAAQTDLLPPLSGGLWLRVVFSPQTQKDFLTGTQWFFDFLMLIPLGIGTLLIKLSAKKDNDPNEDYLYQ